MNHHRELLLELIEQWSDVQLNNYIIELEARLLDVQSTIRELKQIQRKRSRRKKSVLETGARDGR